MIPWTADRGRLFRWQALNVTLLIVGYSGYYLCRSNLSVAMPLLIRELGARGVNIGSAQVLLGSMASLGVLAYAVGKFPSGALADLFGGRRNFLFGMAGSVAFTLLFAASGSLPYFTLAWMGNRLVQSLGWAGAVKVTSRWFSFQRYGTVMGLISLSYLFGDAVARQFMGLLISRGLGWRGVFLTTAVVLASLLLLCTLLLRESPTEIGEREPVANPGNLLQEETRSGTDDRLRSLLRVFLGSRFFWLACGLSLGMTILRETFNLWTPTYFTEAVGMSPGEAASASALFPLLGGVSVLLCGWVSDHLGRRGRPVLMLGGLLLTSVVLIALSFQVIQHSRTWSITLVAAVAFLTLGPYSFLAGAIALDFGGTRGSGTASGMIDGVGYLGGVLSGDSMARISVRYGWNGAFITLACIALVSAMAAAWFMLEQRKMRTRVAAAL